MNGSNSLNIQAMTFSFHKATCACLVFLCPEQVQGSVPGFCDLLILFLFLQLRKKVDLLTLTLPSCTCRITRGCLHYYNSRLQGHQVLIPHWFITWYKSIFPFQELQSLVKERSLAELSDQRRQLCDPLLAVNLFIKISYTHCFDVQFMASMDPATSGSHKHKTGSVVVVPFSWILSVVHFVWWLPACQPGPDPQ